MRRKNQRVLPPFAPQSSSLFSHRLLHRIASKRRRHRIARGTLEIQALEGRALLSGQSIFTNPVLVPNTTYASEATAAIGDLNNDGFLDVVTSNSVLMNDGSGQFIETRLPGYVFASSVAIGDLDGDGDLDLVRGHYGRGSQVVDGRTEILLNDGQGRFNSGGVLEVAEASWVQLGDLDGNGTLDIFVTNDSRSWNPAEHGSQIWLNDGHANFTFAQRLGDGNSNRVTLGDIDKDGDLDAIVSGTLVKGRGADALWLNQGNGHFQLDPQAVDYGGGLYRTQIGDLDGDGILDIVTVNLDDNHANVFLSSKNRTQVSQQIPNAVDVALGDFDGDGDLDAFVVDDGAFSSGPSESFYLNDGTGNLVSQGVIPVGDARAGGAFVALGDFNNDGALDAFVPCLHNHKVFLNTMGSETQQVELTASGGHFTLSLDGQDTVLRDQTNSVLFRRQQDLLTAFSITGSAADDVLTVDLSNGNPLPTSGLSFDGSGGNNRLIVTGGSASTVAVNASGAATGQLVIDVTSVTYSSVVAIENWLTTTNLSFSLPSTNDQVVLSDNSVGDDGVSRLSLVGGVTFDFTTPNAPPLIHAGAGDDTITLSGADSLMTRTVSVFGDDGNDSLAGSSLADSLDGGAGDDSIFGQSGDDTILGGDGNDTLLGGMGRDSVVGGTGNDRINGQGGADSVTGGLGNDTLNGGGGIDCLIESEDVNFTLLPTTLRGLGNDRLAGFDKALLMGGESANVLDASLSNMRVTLIGGGGDDLLKGGSQSDSLDGGDGNDTLLGNDSMAGGSGDDLLIGGSGNDVLNGDVGSDTLTGGNGRDQLFGGADSDSLVGGLGNDALDGGDGTDHLAGGNGRNRSRSASDVFIDPLSEIDELMIVLPKWLTGV